MWKVWITSIIILSVFLPNINAHCVRNGNRYEEIICMNVTAHQLQNELNNILDNVILPDFNVIVATRLIIIDSTVETIKKSLFTNMHLVNIEELIIINSQVKRIELGSFQNMFSLKSLRMIGNSLFEINGNVFPSYITRIDLSMNKLTKLNNFCQVNSALQELILSFNNLGELNEKVFQNCVHLRVLILDNSNIKTIEENTFSMLDNLVNLNISYNKLPAVDFTLSCKLWTLDVSHNKIASFQINYKGSNFQSNLNSLFLNDNNITEINTSFYKTYPSLQLLDLSNNPITIIHPNAIDIITNNDHNNIIIKNSMPHLKQGIFGEQTCGNNLDLSNSGIKTIEANSFISCSYLSELNLQNNKISMLPNKAFNGLNKLKTLILTGNKINVIEPGAFNLSTNPFNLIQELYLSNLNNFEADSYFGLSNLKKISISNSIFETVDSASFRYMPSLNEIHLTNSSIIALNMYAFSGAPNLNYLNLSHNTYEHLKPYVFSSSGSILTLDLGYSTFRNAPNFKKLFKGLDSLQSLILASSNIDSVTSEDFYHLKQLGHLDLSGNRIIEVPEFVFEYLPFLRKLNLGNNEISEISTESFVNGNNLFDLDLSNNHIKSLKVNVFRDLKNLLTLRLENNYLTEIKIGTFSALTSLQHLNISGNRLEYFSEEAFYNLVNLQYLDLRSNVIVFVDMVTAPIENLPSLRYLGISNNYWKCSALVQQLKFLKSKNIQYKTMFSINDYNYDLTNIDGIQCS